MVVCNYAWVGVCVCVCAPHMCMYMSMYGMHCVHVLIYVDCTCVLLPPGRSSANLQGHLHMRRSSNPMPQIRMAWSTTMKSRHLCPYV